MKSAGFYSFDIRRYTDLEPKDYVSYERQSIRRSLLYFDKLIFDPALMDTALNYIDNTVSEIGYAEEYKNLRAEIDYLVNKGLIEIYNIKPATDRSLIPALSTVMNRMRFNEVRLQNYDKTKEGDFVKLFLENQLYYGLLDELICRISAKELAKDSLMSVCPILYPVNSSFKEMADSHNIDCNFLDLKKEKTPATSVVLRKIPVPSMEVSIEQIAEFKADDDTRFKLLALRNWVSDIGRKDLTESEISDRLEYTLNEYKQHLKLHRLKTDLSSFEVYTIAVLEVLENLIKLKFSKAIGNIMTLRRKEIEMLQDELMLPGKEVAYITKVEELAEGDN